MTTDIKEDVLKRSITAGDYAEDPRAGTAMNYIFGAPIVAGRANTDLPAYWSSQRDYALRRTVHMESMWAGAINRAITKWAALGWEIKDNQDSTMRVNRAQELMLYSDAARGWTTFMSKLLRDFLLTDNGVFVEIVRASNALGARIIGLVHLDSCRCLRTGDPDIPILYRDREGKEHEVKDYQLITFADMPDPGDNYNGVGFCAASRAYYTISKLSKLEQYVDEKLGGDGATELTFIKGLSRESLADAIASADAQMKQKGASYYKGKIVVSVMGDGEISEVTIPLKNIPDGFDAKQERDNGYISYSNAIGIPVQDIQPLSGQGLGTGAQTVILDEAAEGQGLVVFGKQLVHAFNTFVLPESTEFAFNNRNDTREQKAKADVASVRANTRAAQIASGEISPAMARQLAVDDKDLPPEFIPDDETAGGQVGDSEKPIDENVRSFANMAMQFQNAPPPIAKPGA